MRSLIFAKKGDAAESRRLRRQVSSGKLEQLHPGIFITPGDEPVENYTRREWSSLVGYLFPGGVVTDRTGMESMPTPSETSGDAYVFVSADKSAQTITLPGLVISQRSGTGPVEGEDVPYIGTWIAGPTRRVLDNISASRSRVGPARTLGPEAVEVHLDQLCSAKGERFLNDLRDSARQLANKIDRKAEFQTLDTMVGTLLGSRKSKMSSAPGRARAAGHPIDMDCLSRMEKMYGFLMTHPSEEIPDPNTSWKARTNSCFVEAYFSNYIEGTRFLVSEARDIVFEGRIPDARPEDGHDVLATYLKLMEPPRPRLDEMDAEQFILSLQLDHNDIMLQRPSVKPGEFKTTSNAAGNTVFVLPEKVYGTLQEGFALVQAGSDPFSRALLAKLLVSEVHPFNDGNGRLSRITMSRELISNGLSHIVVPTVFRDDYLNAMRAMTRRSDPEILVRSMQLCQKISAACSSDDLETCVNTWASTHAFVEEGRHATLTEPLGPNEVAWRDDVPAPKSYWRSVDGDDGTGLLGSKIRGS